MDDCYIKVYLKAEPTVRVELEITKRNKWAKLCRSLSTRFPGEFLCPISQRLMQEPVLLFPSGQTYERRNIQEWLMKAGSQHATCPMTGAKVTTTKLAVNATLKNVIEKWQQQHRVQKGVERMDSIQAAPVSANKRIALQLKKGVIVNPDILSGHRLTVLRNGMWHTGQIHSDFVGSWVLDYGRGNGPGQERTENIQLSEFRGRHVSLTAGSATYDAEWLSCHVITEDLPEEGEGQGTEAVVVRRPRGSGPVRLRLAENGTVLNPEDFLGATGEMIWEGSERIFVVRSYSARTGSAPAWKLHVLGDIDLALDEFNCFAAFNPDFSSIVWPGADAGKQLPVKWQNVSIETEQTKEAYVAPPLPKLKLLLGPGWAPRDPQLLVGQQMWLGPHHDVYQVTKPAPVEPRPPGPVTPVQYTLFCAEYGSSKEGVFNSDFSYFREKINASGKVEWQSCQLEVVRDPEGPQEPTIVLQKAVDGTVLNPEVLMGHHFEMPDQHFWTVSMVTDSCPPGPYPRWMTSLDTGAGYFGDFMEDGTFDCGCGDKPLPIRWLTCSVRWEQTDIVLDTPLTPTVTLFAPSITTPVTNHEVLLGQPIVVLQQNDETVVAARLRGVVHAYQGHNVQYRWLMTFPFGGREWGDFDADFTTFVTITGRRKVGWLTCKPQLELTGTSSREEQAGEGKTEGHQGDVGNRRGVAGQLREVLGKLGGAWRAPGALGVVGITALLVATACFRSRKKNATSRS